MTGKEKEVGLDLRDGSGQRDGSMAFTDFTEESFAGALCLKWTPGGASPCRYRIEPRQCWTEI